MLSPPNFNNSSNPSYFKKLIAIGLFLSLGLPIIGSAISLIYLPDWRAPHEPFHAVIEGIGGIIALILSGILLALTKYNQNKKIEHLWMACALISMGLLDIFHAAVSPGKLFVWLHSTAQFAGGMFFTLVWLPEKIGRYFYSIKLPIYISVGA